MYPFTLTPPMHCEEDFKSHTAEGGQDCEVVHDTAVTGGDQGMKLRPTARDGHSYSTRIEYGVVSVEYCGVYPEVATLMAAEGVTKLGVNEVKVRV